MAESVGIIQPDLILRDSLVSFFAALQADSALIDRVFPNRPAPERAEMRAYFEAHGMPVKLGYPGGHSELPGVFITLGALQESYQTLGGTFTETFVDDTFTEWQGSFFTSVVRLSCWTLGGQLTVWLQSLVFARLLGVKETLNNDGLSEIKLNATDFEPLPQWFPTVAFRRDVSFVSTMPLTVPKDYPAIDDVIVEAEAVPSTGLSIVAAG